MTRTALIVFALLCSGCQLPEFRVGQANVPGPLKITHEQREAWRQGADYVAKTIEGPVETVYVADELTASLGAPEAPLEDPEAVVRELRDAYRTQEQALQKIMQRLEKFEGKEIEGTGVDLAPWGGGLGLVIIIAACVLVPGFASFLFFALRRMRAALVQVVNGVQAYKLERPEDAKALLDSLSKKMDTSQKMLIRKLRA